MFSARDFLPIARGSSRAPARSRHPGPRGPGTGPPVPAPQASPAVVWWARASRSSIRSGHT
eukprot:7566454-Pyramimonas_sp.AAC.1